MSNNSSVLVYLRNGFKFTVTQEVLTTLLNIITYPNASAVNILAYSISSVNSVDLVDSVVSVHSCNLILNEHNLQNVSIIIGKNNNDSIISYEMNCKFANTLNILNITYQESNVTIAYNISNITNQTPGIYKQFLNLALVNGIKIYNSAESIGSPISSSNLTFFSLMINHNFLLY